jgi:hypothetical protein
MKMVIKLNLLVFFCCFMFSGFVSKHAFATDDPDEFVTPSKKIIKYKGEKSASKKRQRGGEECQDIVLQSAGGASVRMLFDSSYWDHHLKEDNITRGYSVMVKTKKPSGRTTITESDGKEYEVELSARCTDKRHHQIERCQCGHGRECSHFEVDIEHLQVREFVKVFFETEEGERIVVPGKDRHLLRSHTMNVRERIRNIGITETNGVFTRRFQRVDVMKLHVDLGDGSKKDIKREIPKPEETQRLIAKHVRFDDHWDEGFSYQVVGLYTDEGDAEPLDEVTCVRKIKHQERKQYHHDDDKHVTTIYVHKAYQGMNNSLCYDSSNILDNWIVNPDPLETKTKRHQREEVVIEKNWLLPNYKRATYTRPDGQGTYSCDYHVFE